jgi:hypothetical protein
MVAQQDETACVGEPAVERAHFPSRTWIERWYAMMRPMRFATTRSFSGAVADSDLLEIVSELREPRGAALVERLVRIASRAASNGKRRE